MPLASRADVIAGVRDWLARPGDTATLPDGALGLALEMAEAEVNARLRHPDAEAVASLAFGADGRAALPADFAEARSLSLDDHSGASVPYLAPGVFAGRYAGAPAAWPEAFTVEGRAARLGPAPGVASAGRLLYRANLPAIGAAGHAVLAAHPDLYLYGALAHVAAYTADDARVGLWRAGFEAALARANAAGERASYAGPLTIQAG